MSLSASNPAKASIPFALICWLPPMVEIPSTLPLIFNGTELGPNYKPEERTAKSDRHHAERRSPLNGPDGASYGSLTIQLAGDGGIDCYAGVHLNQLRFQSLFAEKTFFLAKEEVHVINSTAGIGDSDFLQRRLSSDRFYGKERAQANGR